MLQQKGMLNSSSKEASIETDDVKIDMSTDTEKKRVDSVLDLCVCSIQRCVF